MGDPLGAALGAAGNVLGSITNAISQKKARKQQERQYQQSFKENQRQYDTSLAEDQRQFDASLAEQQRQFDAGLEYNSASAQKARFEEAGINPYIAMSGAGATSASMSSGGSTGSPGATSVNGGSIPTQDIGSMLGAAGEAYQQGMVNDANIRNINSQTEGNELDNDIKQIQLRYEDGNQQLLREINDYIAAGKHEEVKWLRNSYDKRMELMNIEVDIKSQEKVFNDLNNRITQFNADVLPIQWTVGLKEVLSNINLNDKKAQEALSAITLNHANANKAVKEAGWFSQLSKNLKIEEGILIEQFISQCFPSLIAFERGSIDYEALMSDEGQDLLKTIAPLKLEDESSSAIMSHWSQQNVYNVLKDRSSKKDDGVNNPYGTQSKYGYFPDKGTKYSSYNILEYGSMGYFAEFWQRCADNRLGKWNATANIIGAVGSAARGH